MRASILEYVVPVFLSVCAVLFFQSASAADPVEGFTWKVASASLGTDGELSVKAAVSVTVTSPFLDKDGAVILRPYLGTAEGNPVMNFPPVSVYGVRAYRRCRLTPLSGAKNEAAICVAAGGLSRTLSLKVPVNLLPQDSLFLRVSVQEYDRKKGFGSVSIRECGVFVKPACPWPSDGLRWTPRKPGEERNGTRKFEAFFPLSFLPGNGSLDDSLGDNALRMEELYDCVWGFLGSGAVKPQGAELVYKCAPAGNADKSLALSRRRARAVFDSLRSAGALKRFTPQVSGGGENYPGAKRWIEASSLVVPPKVLELFSGRTDDAAYRKAEKEWPDVFEVLKGQCYQAVDGVLFKCSYREAVSAGDAAGRERLASDCPWAMTAADWYEYASDAAPSRSEWGRRLAIAAAQYCPLDAGLAFDATMAMLEERDFRRAALCARGLQEGADEVYALAVLALGVGNVDWFLELASDLLKTNPEYRPAITALDPAYHWTRGWCAWEWKAGELSLENSK